MINALSYIFGLFLLITVIVIAFSSNLWPNQEQWLFLLSKQHIGVASSVLFVVCMSIIIRGIRWHIVLGKYSPSSTNIIVLGFCWCFLILQLFPFRAGEAARVGWLSIRGANILQSIGSIFIERIADVIVLIILLLFAILNIQELTNYINISNLIIIFLLIIFLITAIFIILNYYKKTDIKKTHNQLHKKITIFFRNFALINNIQQIIILSVLTVITWLSLMTVFFFYLNSMHAISLSACAALLALTNLSSFITIAPGNLGVYEAAGVLVLVAYGITPDEAIISVTGLHAIIFTGQLLTGVLSRLILLILEGR